MTSTASREGVWLAALRWVLEAEAQSPQAARALAELSVTRVGPRAVGSE